MSQRWLNQFLGRSTASSISRRQLLRLGIAAGAGLLSNQNYGAQKSQKKPRVLIVGAGFSGLACAFELAAAGYEVNVLEARKRVGGRVISLRDFLPGKVLEGGGEMLGSNHPHALAYAARFGFEFQNVNDGDDLHTTLIGGKRLTPREIADISVEIDQVQRNMTSDAKAVIADEPWKTPGAEQFDKLATSTWIDRQAISNLAKALLTVQLTATNGVAASRQSYLGNLAQVCGGGLEKYWTDTELFRLKGGNQQFAERMAQELGHERVRVDCAVREIRSTESSVTVIDATGQVHQADDVVLAIPPSVWPVIKFSPKLPETLNPQMGMNVKFLAVVRDRFWKLHASHAKATTDQDISSVWEGTEGQGEEGPAALVAFSGGPPAESNHRRAVADRQPTYVKGLEQLFPGFQEQFIKGQFMDWIADAWTRAGYSFPAPGQVTTQGPVFRAGLGRMHFAGEHTCYQFVGYMEGALNSGASLARRLAVRDGIA